MELSSRLTQASMGNQTGGIRIQANKGTVSKKILTLDLRHFGTKQLFLSHVVGAASYACK